MAVSLLSFLLSSLRSILRLWIVVMNEALVVWTCVRVRYVLMVWGLSLVLLVNVRVIYVGLVPLTPLIICRIVVGLRVLTLRQKFLISPWPPTRTIVGGTGSVVRILVTIMVTLILRRNDSELMLMTLTLVRANLWKCFLRGCLLC